MIGNSRVNSFGILKLVSARSFFDDVMRSCRYYFKDAFEKSNLLKMHAPGKYQVLTLFPVNHLTGSSSTTNNNLQCRSGQAPWQHKSLYSPPQCVPGKSFCCKGWPCFRFYSMNKLTDQDAVKNQTRTLFELIYILLIKINVQCCIIIANRT